MPRFGLWATLCGLFLTGLFGYLQLLVWKKHGDDLMLTAANIVFTSVLWVVLVAAILMYVSQRKKFAKESGQPRLTEALIEQIEKVGQLRSLAGQAGWLARKLEELWYEFDKSQKKLIYPLGKNVIPVSLAKMLATRRISNLHP